MNDERRAGDLSEGQFFREYGMSDTHKIAELNYHGDIVLITCEEGCKVALDSDEVVEGMDFAPTGISGTVTLANGRSYSFSIGAETGWQQWGEIPEVLGHGVDLMDGLVEKIGEDNLLVDPH